MLSLETLARVRCRTTDLLMMTTIVLVFFITERETFLVAASWRNRRIEVCSQSEKRKSVPVSAFSLELSWRQILKQMPKANQSILTW